MKAKTNGARLIILPQGTHLVPTHDAVQIKDGEVNHVFTQSLVESGEVVLSGESVQVTPPVEQVAPPTEQDDLRAALSKKKKSELLEMCESVGIEASDRDTNSQLIDKLVAHEFGQ